MTDAEGKANVPESPIPEDQNLKRVPLTFVNLMLATSNTIDQSAMEKLRKIAEQKGKPTFSFQYYMDSDRLAYPNVQTGEVSPRSLIDLPSNFSETGEVKPILLTQ
eukprot:Tbor_TRINITY_DN5649_c0_g7::TRINITY_DN5649_c0_g7_i1::g.8378::m.8378